MAYCILASIIDVYTPQIEVSLDIYTIHSITQWLMDNTFMISIAHTHLWFVGKLEAVWQLLKQSFAMTVAHCT